MIKSIKSLITRDTIDPKSRLAKKYAQFETLLETLKEKHLTDEIITTINGEVDLLNEVAFADDKLGKVIKKSQTKLLKLLESELDLVPLNHYRNLWIALGMAVIGIPLGTAVGSIFENMGFIGLGMPIGMAIGIVIGMMKDKKAAEYGKQLNVEIKY